MFTKVHNWAVLSQLNLIYILINYFYVDLLILVPSTNKSPDRSFPLIFIY